MAGGGRRDVRLILQAEGGSFFKDVPPELAASSAVLSDAADHGGEVILGSVTPAQYDTWARVTLAAQDATGSEPSFEEICVSLKERSPAFVLLLCSASLAWPS